MSRFCIPDGYQQESVITLTRLIDEVPIAKSVEFGGSRIELVIVMHRRAGRPAVKRRPKRSKKPWIRVTFSPASQNRSYRLHRLQRVRALPRSDYTWRCRSQILRTNVGRWVSPPSRIRTSRESPRRSIRAGRGVTLLYRGPRARANRQSASTRRRRKRPARALGIALGST